LWGRSILLRRTSKPVRRLKRQQKQVVADLIPSVTTTRATRKATVAARKKIKECMG